MPLIWSSPSRLVGDAIPCEGVLYQRLVQPLLLAALNVDPPEGSAGLAGAIVRETLLAGGQACRPLIAREGLSAVLVEPAIKLLQGKGADIRFGQELRGFGSAADRVNELKFGEETVSLAPSDVVVLAVPPRPAASLLPGLKTPSKFRAIVNGHFRFDPPKDVPPILGVVGGLVEWLFAFPQRLSITISGADRLVDMPREELAQAHLAGYLPGCRASRPNCRPGRSCASAVPHLRRRRNRTPCGRAPRRPSKTCFLPATGLIRGCRRPSKVRCGRVTARPISSSPAGDRQGRKAFSEIGRTRSGDVERICIPQPAQLEGGSALETSINSATQALLEYRQADGHWVFELEADCTIPCRICAARSLSRRAGRYGAGSQNRQLPAADSGRPWRLAAGP